MFKNLKRLFSPNQEKAAPDGFWTSFNHEIPVEKLGNYTNYLCAASSKLHTAWKAADITATHVMTQSYTIENQRSQRVSNKRLDSLLEIPNEYDTFSEMLYRTAMHVDFVGNAYWYKCNANLDGNQPEELLMLNPKNVHIHGHSRKKVSQYEYRVNGRNIYFEPHEIIHFKRPHPDNEFYGIGCIESSEQLLQTGLNQNSSTEAFYRNGGQPSGIMSNDDFQGSQGDLKKVKTKFDQDHVGSDKAGKILWLTGSWKYQALGISQRDAQTIESSKMTKEEISLAFGVPLEILGLREANSAGGGDAMSRFLSGTVMQHIERIQSTLNRSLISGYGKGLSINFSVIGLKPLEQMSKAYTPFFDRGAITPNQLRKLIGLRPDPTNPHGDTYFINQAFVPVEMSGMAVSLNQAQSQVTAPSQSANTPRQARDGQ